MIKKSFQLGLIIIVLVALHLYSQQEEEILQETIRVVNVEVPVRVYYRGKPVENLTKNDFKLFEKGKQQDIHGFILKRKKINVQELKLNAEQVI